MAGKRKPRYSGLLNQPIVRWAGFRSITAEPNEQRIIREWIAKVPLLLAHYGIAPNDPDRWRALAFLLALDHVPGMQVIDRPRPKRGAPQKWNLARAREFIRLIEQIAGERGEGVKDAIRIAKRRKQVQGNDRGLENRYHDSKKRLREADELLRRAEAWLDEARLGIFAKK
jgi:hypothetical protein